MEIQGKSSGEKYCWREGISRMFSGENTSGGTIDFNNRLVYIITYYYYYY